MAGTTSPEPHSARKPPSPLLVAAFLVSLAFHAALLSANFIAPARDPVPSRDRGLEVVLVNARHAQAPEKAELLAQSNLDGGGTTERDARPTTPLPAQEGRTEGEALRDAQKAATEKAPAREKVLTRPEPAPDKPTASIAPRPDPQHDAPPEPQKPTTSGRDVLDSIAAVARLEAQIDRNLSEYAKRPRKQFIGARTREYRFAQYVEDWRQKVERVGTLNYPENARGRTYGSLLLSVVIRADGSLERVTVQRSSGHKVLDDAAVRIVELAGPFAPFPPDVRVDTDIIEITRTWTFTNTDQVRAR